MSIIPPQPYNSIDIKIYIDAQQLTGLVKETFCDIKYNDKMVMMQLDTSGEDGDYAITNDLSATIEFKLRQKASGNDLLLDKFLADLNGGTGGFHLIIYDNNSKIKYEAAVAHVEKFPDKSYANELQTLSWAVITTRLVPTRIENIDVYIQNFSVNV